MAAGQVASEEDRTVSKHEIGTKYWSWRLRKEQRRISSRHDKSDLKEIKLMMHSDFLDQLKKNSNGDERISGLIRRIQIDWVTSFSCSGRFSLDADKHSVSSLLNWLQQV